MKSPESANSASSIPRFIRHMASATECKGKCVDDDFQVTEMRGSLESEENKSKGEAVCTTAEEVLLGHFLSAAKAPVDVDGTLHKVTKDNCIPNFQQERQPLRNLNVTSRREGSLGSLWDVPKLQLAPGILITLECLLFIAVAFCFYEWQAGIPLSAASTR